jgi:serine/threonine protein kinase
MIGKTLAHYEILSKIGEGGMGIVWKARDTDLDREVAIKILPEIYTADADRLKRFEQEARLLASLNHPNIATVHGLHEAEGIRFIAMEYVPGTTLAHRLVRGSIPVGETLELASQIAQALEAAHESGIIHRDLKPANIMMRGDGTVTVLDFGLAKPSAVPPVGDSATEVTLTAMPGTVDGAILGTPQYMSPEQVRSGDVDRRTDIWALGVVLFECLTGTNPFARSSIGECLAAIFSDAPDFSELPANTPPEVASLIARCLRKDARKRQRDAGDSHLVLEDAFTTLHAGAPAALRTRLITEGRFRISDGLCRALDRSGFDALLPGWEMRYADNNMESDVLIVWIPSIGGDHTTTQWRELIAAAPYRMVIVTPVGMEPGVDNRPVVSLENQLAMIRSLTGDLRSRLNPGKTVISGFSCGSIMALRCAAGDESGVLFDGILAIDADLQESDCFVTRLFAGLDASSAPGVMNGLCKISTSCETVHEWLVLHQHMVECVDKVKSDFSPLIRQGKDLSADYEGVHTGAESPFVEILHNALQRAGKVRCVFHDSAENRRILGEIRMMHLDKQVLGPLFTDGTFAFLPVPDHIGMMSNDRLLEQLDGIVEAVRG